MKLGAIAQAVGGRLVGDGDREVRRPIHPAEATDPADLAMAMDPSLLELLAASPAQAAMVAEGMAVPEGVVEAWIEVPRPRFALAGVTDLFAIPVQVAPGVHPSAVVEPDAHLEPGVRVGPLAYVGARARIGAGTIIMAHATIGADAVVGPDGLIHPGVRIGERVQVGARVILHHNVSLGADGFSFVTPDRGSVESAKTTGKVEATNLALRRIFSLGGVVIGDDVEIGANTAIDRGTLSDTRIGSGTKIDNLVQIGHNVVVGSLCMLCGQVGLAGSVVIGDRVVLAGKVGVADHVRIGNDCVVAAYSGVGTDLPPRSVYMGIPAVPRQQAFEQFRLIRRLRRLFNDVATLKTRLAGLEGQERQTHQTQTHQTQTHQTQTHQTHQTR